MAIEFDRNLFARINFGGLALTITLVIFAWNAPAFAQGIPSHPGAPIYKQAGCITCHKWPPTDYHRTSLQVPSTVAMPALPPVPDGPKSAIRCIAQLL